MYIWHMFTIISDRQRKQKSRQGVLPFQQPLLEDCSEDACAACLSLQIMFSSQRIDHFSHGAIQKKLEGLKVQDLYIKKQALYYFSKSHNKVF